MENKTPEQWFMKLKEPYRSDAIKGINKEVLHFKEYPKNLSEALYFSLHWGEPCETTRNDWDVIYNSILAGETTYLEPENVSLINEVNNSQVTEQQNEIESEKVELRPEDLKAGEVKLNDLEFNKPYKYVIGNYYILFTFRGFYQNESYTLIQYFIKLHKDGYVLINGDFTREIGSKLYHATPEEKALLLGEEQTDLDYWRKRSESATKGLEGLQKDYNELNAKFDALAHKYNELKDEYKRLSDYDEELEKSAKEQSKLIETLRNELKEKESKEKVYFCFSSVTNKYLFYEKLNKALEISDEGFQVYEAVCIGKKKSVLVSE